MNRYFGWYERKIQDIKPWIEKKWKKKSFYPETFQTKTHEYQWGVIAEHPYIIASYLWNMFDLPFRCGKEGIRCSLIQKD